MPAFWYFALEQEFLGYAIAPFLKMLKHGETIWNFQDGKNLPDVFHVHISVSPTGQNLQSPVPSDAKTWNK